MFGLRASLTHPGSRRRRRRRRPRWRACVGTILCAACFIYARRTAPSVLKPRDRYARRYRRCNFDGIPATIPLIAMCIRSVSSSSYQILM